MNKSEMQFKRTTYQATAKGQPVTYRCYEAELGHRTIRIEGTSRYEWLITVFNYDMPAYPDGSPAIEDTYIRDTYKRAKEFIGALLD